MHLRSSDGPYAFILRQTNANLLASTPEYVAGQSTDMLREAYRHLLQQAVESLAATDSAAADIFINVFDAGDAWERRLGQRWLDANHLSAVWEEVATIRFLAMGAVQWAENPKIEDRQEHY